MGGAAFEPDHADGPRICIATLEGVHLATPGDFIIQGIKVEIYPCKPDNFEMTYEATDDKPRPCWCPYCGEPHSIAVAEDPDATNTV